MRAYMKKRKICNCKQLKNDEEDHIHVQLSCQD